ncbi:unnamed protein product [Rhizophagus irregularis]|nr:unnamed protein product [Rhizophagus irregularis]
MFALIFFAITFGFIINFIPKFNKKPEGLENIPYISFISLLKYCGLHLQQKNYDEVEDLVQELIGESVRHCSQQS